MPSFDIVCEVDFQEVDNATNQAAREIENRFDFKGGKSKIHFNKNERRIEIFADDELKLRAIHQILESKLAKRNVDLRSLVYGKKEEASGNAIRQFASLRCGLDKEDAKKVTKQIKDSKMKIQAQIQDDQVRVTGKKIDDLQACIAMLRASDIGLPLQFVNMRS